MCVWGLCMRVFNFITRRKLRKVESKKREKKKQLRKRKATSHLQSFYAMSRTEETQKEQEG